jgi:hypothetical protein
MSEENKPDLELLMKFIKRKEKIKKMHQELDDKIMTLMMKLGPCTHTYELPSETEEGHKFLRFSLVDNMELFQLGEPLFRAASFKRFEIDYKFLKNEPKETKGKKKE